MADIYEIAAKAYDRRDDPAELEPPRAPSVLANHPPFRAAVDAAAKHDRERIAAWIDGLDLDSWTAEDIAHKIRGAA